MTFKNPIVGGETLITPAIQSENWETSDVGATGWRITREGEASFNAVEIEGNVTGEQAAYDVVSANEDFYYQGNELADILDKHPRGLVGFADWHEGGDTATYPSDGNIYSILAVDVDIEAGRAYEVFYQLTLITSNGGWFHLDFNIQPGPAMRSITYARSNQNYLEGSFIWYPTATQEKTITIGGRSRAVGDWYFGINNIYPAKLWVKDIGLPVTDRSYRVGNPPSQTWHTFDIDCYASRSYAGDGSLRYSDGENMNQGYYSGTWGNQVSACFFDDNTIKQLQGVPRSDIDYLEIYVYFGHWYYGSGGDAIIGYHNDLGSPNSTYSPSRYTNDVFREHFGRNSGRWIDIKNTSLQTALENGVFRGYALGRGPTNSRSYYGNAHGDNMTNQPRIRARFLK